MQTSNQKFEMTDIAHEKYPFLHRIRALRDIGSEVKAGDLGGFVESEGNLSFEPGDDAYLRGAKLSQCARVSGNGMVLKSPNTKVSPILSGNCAVYGKVMGDVMLAGTVVVISDETISNDSLDTLSINEKGCTILRDPSRDELAPHRPQEQQKKPKSRGRNR